MAADVTRRYNTSIVPFSFVSLDVPILEVINFGGYDLGDYELLRIPDYGGIDLLRLQLWSL